MAYKILVVDDESDVRELVKATLETSFEEYKFEEASDGEDALIKINRGKPDFIILDLKMPKLDGNGVIKKLRTDIITKNIPILVLTVKNGLEPRQEAFELGADLYLTKPFDPEELRTLVRGILSGKIPTRRQK